jgi:hypothetical protein
MAAARSFDAGAVSATIAELLGPDDARRTRLRQIVERATATDRDSPEPRFEIPRRPRNRRQS